jgi:uncharacterized protein YggE
MKRIAFAVVLLLAATALVGALRPEGAEAVDPAPATDSVSVTGTGVVVAVPDQAQVSAGVESRAQTASAALAANAAAMRKVLDALRDRGGSDVTTQTVSLQTAFDDQGQPNGFVATNVASATTGLDAAGALIDAAVDTGANTIYGPSLERSDAEKLYRDALEKAVADAKGRATVLAEAAGRTLGRVTAMTESGSAELPMLAKDAAAARESTPIVSGAQETTATVSVTYELK